jgi:hypothetical protein
MNHIEDNLSSFTDTELAYMYRFQLGSYMEATQSKIRIYIFDKRKLTENIIADLIAKDATELHTSDNKHCPRCHTTKLRSEKVAWVLPLYKSGAEDELAMLHEIHTGEHYYKTKIACNVCGFIISDPNNERIPWYRKISNVIFDHPFWSLLKRK